MISLRYITAVVSLLLIAAFTASYPNIVDGAETSTIGDIVFSDKLDSMKEVGVGPVVFPHTIHTEAFECADCHPKIFKDEIGANNISMKQNMEGESCGSMNCHCGMLDCYDSERTFPLYLCANCHTEVEGTE